MENESYKVYEADLLLKNISYPGRGIILGTAPDKKHFALAYFISGRSENSRNRVFEKTSDGTLRTIPFDPSKVTDPSLIIYNAVRQLQNNTIVTNGDQTDTVFEGLSQGKTFSESLESRCFEPDFPNYTPRISGILYAGDENKAKYELSILKSADENGSACHRYTFSYAPIAGIGHFIRTYINDGNPLPTFSGEPVRVAIPDTADRFADLLWNALNEENKISLYVRYIDIATGTYTDRLINKH